MSSIDTSPLNLAITQEGYKKIEKVLKENPDVEAYSPRIKLSAMLSNYTETTNVRLNAIDPKEEIKVCPNVSERMKFSGSEIPDILLKPGEILIPENLTKGLNIKNPIAYILPQSKMRWQKFVDTWLVYQANSSLSDNAYQFWILGKSKYNRVPRWSFAHDVLGWNFNEIE